MENIKKIYSFLHSTLKISIFFEKFKVKTGETYAPRYSRQVNCVS